MSVFSGTMLQCVRERVACLPILPFAVKLFNYPLAKTCMQFFTTQWNKLQVEGLPPKYSFKLKPSIEYELLVAKVDQSCEQPDIQLPEKEYTTK